MATDYPSNKEGRKAVTNTVPTITLEKIKEEKEDFQLSVWERVQLEDGFP